MAVTSKEVFDFAIERAEHSLTMYDILHNSRQRDGRRDWLDNFKRFMRWPVRENIVRIDGRNQNSMLIIREVVGIDRNHFAHDFVCDLLRSAVVAAVSALDKYMHDIVVEKCWKLLDGPEKNVPKELAALRVPVLSTKKALDKLRKNRSARPGSQIKADIQNMLHREFTFQNVHGIEKGSKILGVQDFWGQIAAAMPGNPSKGDVQKRLTQIASRRNRIVHEADIVRRISAKNITQNRIGRKEAIDMVQWVKDFVGEMDTLFN